MTTNTQRSMAALMVCFGLVAGGCGDGSNGDGTEATITDEVVAAEPDGTEPEIATETTVAPGETTPSEDGAPDETAEESGPIELEPASGETTGVAASALGGVRFEYPTDMSHLSLDDLLLVHPAGADPNDANVSIQLVTQFSSGSEVDGLESVLAAIGASHEIEPTATVIDFQGYVLEGFEMRGPVDTQVFANSRFPAPVQAAGGPNVFARLFVGDTPSGIMVVGVGGANKAAADSMLPALGTVLASFEFTGPGLAPALPPGETLQPADAGAPPPPVEEVDDPLIPELGAPFAPASEGRHELVNFGLAVSLDFAGGWFVQPNFPGLVVLSDPLSVGPNDRDVVFINSIVEFVPIAGGPTRAGDPIAIDDIDAFLDAPPGRVTVSSVDRFQLMAASGETTSVVSFDLAIADGASCSAEDPCEWAFVTNYGFVKPVRMGDVHRIWWFPEHPNGPAAAVAAASQANAAWIDDAAALIATLELSR